MSSNAIRPKMLVRPLQPAIPYPSLVSNGRRQRRAMGTEADDGASAQSQPMPESASHSRQHVEEVRSSFRKMAYRSRGGVDLNSPRYADTR